MRTSRNRTVPFDKPAEDDSRDELFDLIERLKNGEDRVMDELVRFIFSESKGYWNGRARAKICRNLKNRLLDNASRLGRVTAMFDRAETGNFSEQFAISFDWRFDSHRIGCMKSLRGYRQQTNPMYAASHFGGSVSLNGSKGLRNETRCPIAEFRNVK